MTYSNQDHKTFILEVDSEGFMRLFYVYDRTQVKAIKANSTAAKVYTGKAQSMRKHYKGYTLEEFCDSLNWADSKDSHSFEYYFN